MKKISLYTLLSLIIFVSCTNLTKNMVKLGEFSIRSGNYKKTTWDESLDFKRISWFHELTLLYDAIYVSLDEQSKFNNWFSLEEERRLKNCGEKLVTLTYSLDSERISHQMFYSQLRNLGYEQFVVPDFTRALKMHPDFEQLSLTLYKINIFCRKEKYAGEIPINFPSFQEVKL